jgi:hypothetical protein
MNSIIDVLRHLVEHVGGWASDVEKAGAHAVLSDIERQLVEAGMITKPEQPAEPTEPVEAAPSVPSPPPATGTGSDSSPLADAEPA